MNIRKRTIMHLLGVLATVLIKAGFPVIAYAHAGLEPKMEYVMLLGFAVGLIVGIASVVYRIWLPKALFLSTAFLFAILLLGGLFIPKISMSDIFSSTVPFITIGIVLPLSLGAVVIN